MRIFVCTVSIQTAISVEIAAFEKVREEAISVRTADFPKVPKIWTADGSD